MLDTVDRYMPYFVAMFVGAIMGTANASLLAVVIATVPLVVWGCWWRFIREQENNE